MRKFSLIIVAIAAAFTLSSCGGVRMSHKAPSTALAPSSVRVNVDNSKIRCLGEVTVTVNSTVYLGIIRDIKTINGETYDFRNVKTTSLVGKKGFYYPSVLNKATYKVVETYPQADFYEPAYVTKERHSMFLGHTETVTMVIRAYQYVR